MLVSAIPTKMPLIWGVNAGASYIHAVPIPTQIGITTGAASFNDGFPPLTGTAINAGGVPPSIQDFNGAINAITAWNQWQQAGAPVMYDASFCTSGAQNIGGYPKGAILMATDQSHTWLNTIDGNTSNPDTGGVGWINLGTQGLAGARNLQITYNAGTATISCDEAVLANAQGGTLKVLNVSATINFLASGTNGLDTGAFASGTGYNMWLAYSPSANQICGIGSTVSGSGGPTLPAAFTHKVRLGANFASSGTAFFSVRQLGRCVQFIAGVRVLASGSAGTNTAISLSGFTPPTAIRASYIYSNVGNASVRFQPENTFWSPGQSPGFVSTDNTWGAAAQFQIPILMQIPVNGQVFWSAGATANSISLVGWEDNVNA